MSVDDKGREYVDHPPLKPGEALTLRYGEAVTLTALGEVEVSNRGVVTRLKAGESVTFENDSLLPITISRSY